MSISRAEGVAAVSGSRTKLGGLKKSAGVGTVVARVEGKKRSPTHSAEASEPAASASRKPGTAAHNALRAVISLPPPPDANALLHPPRGGGAPSAMLPRRSFMMTHRGLTYARG